MRRAVIGSRGFPDAAWHVSQLVDSFPPGTVVRSGGAGGPDSFAESRARERGLIFEPVYADWDTFGKIAGKRRNWPLVKGSDHVDALWDGWSNGTAHAVTAAVALGVPVVVHLSPRLRLDDLAPDARAEA